MAPGSSTHALNGAIKSIYDAALDWHAWPAALDGLADAVKASAAQFGSYNAATHSLQTVMPRIDPDYRQASSSTGRAATPYGSGAASCRSAR